jgi:hypothetical protein
MSLPLLIQSAKDTLASERNGHIPYRSTNRLYLYHWFNGRRSNPSMVTCSSHATIPPAVLGWANYLPLLLVAGFVAMTNSPPYLRAVAISFDLSLRRSTVSPRCWLDRNNLPGHILRLLEAAAADAVERSYSFVSYSTVYDSIW